MRKMLCLAIVCLMALSAVFVAPPNAVADHLDWYARGDFNGYDLSSPMVLQAGPYHTKTITGLTTGTAYNYKIALEDWSASAPGSDGRVTADASGEINFHFWETDVWADGWEPSAKMRVGYDDHDQFDWEIAGAMNGWAGGDLLIDQGGGLHTGTIALSAGSYSWKFRKQGDWDTAIGDDFGNSAADNSITVANNGDVWGFELDLPNGRWRAYLVPEPSSMALAGLALMGIVFCSARRENGSK